MPRRGFTLLEVLLALALSSMLMAGLFATLRVQGRMAREGGRRVEIAQLARGLLERMADDVRSSISPEVGLPQEVGLIDESFLLRSDGGWRVLSAAWPRDTLVNPLYPGATPGLGPATHRLPRPLKTLATRSDLPGIGLFGDAEYLVVSPRAGNALLSGDVASGWETHAGGATSTGRVSGTLSQEPDSAFRNPANAIGTSLGRNTVVGLSDQQTSSGLPEPPRGSAGVAYFLVRDRSRVVMGDAFDAQSVAGLARLELTRSHSETATALIDEALKHLEGPLNGGGTGTEDDGPTLDEVETATQEEARQHDQSFSAPGLRVEFLAPEVRWLRFRYLGPFGWESDWTSHTTMPRAVEIAVGLKTDEREFTRPTKSNEDRKSMAADSEEEPFEFSVLQRDSVVPPGLQVYRLTVRVPTGLARGVLRTGNTVTERTTLTGR